eukprot:scaffold50337_cov32-Prasinocladus_malaysianus.AAC.1
MINDTSWVSFFYGSLPGLFLPSEHAVVSGHPIKHPMLSNRLSIGTHYNPSFRSVQLVDTLGSFSQ